LQLEQFQEHVLLLMLLLIVSLQSFQSTKTCPQVCPRLESLDRRDYEQELAIPSVTGLQTQYCGGLNLLARPAPNYNWVPECGHVALSGFMR
jgi:hypothetical protein